MGGRYEIWNNIRVSLKGGVSEISVGFNGDKEKACNASI
jgi:hypothetical protein